MSKNVHLIGIGGSGLSAIARLLVESGYSVSGCDQVSSPITDELQLLGIRVHIGHHSDHVLDKDLVIQSSAIPDDNLEIETAKQLGIPVLKRSSFFPTFLEGKKTIAVAGTHGKTTTTAIIAWLLTCMDLEPGYLIGGTSKNLKNNAHAGASELFVIEADEYDLMFLGLKPDIALLTNLDYDHPDFFPTQESYFSAFEKFLQCLKPNGVLLLDQENPKAIRLIEGAPENLTYFTYGFSDTANYQAVNLRPKAGGGHIFDVKTNSLPIGIELSAVELNIPGEHNVRNALGALAVIHQIGHDPKIASKHLQEFVGTGRRFDVLGEYNGIQLIDDYAHHPTEIESTLRAARVRYPECRIISVWQPHTFTRSKAFFNEFLTAFTEVDEVIITEVYAARESDPGFSARTMAEQLLHENVHFIVDLKSVVNYLIGHLLPGDVLIVLSAGDAIKINESLKEHYTNNAPALPTQDKVKTSNSF